MAAGRSTRGWGFLALGIGLALSVVIAAVASRPAARFSAPGQARPWARDAYERLTSASPLARPPLTRPKPEPLQVTSEPNGVTKLSLPLQRGERRAGRTAELMTKLTAGPDLCCALPGSPGSLGAPELELVAFARRSLTAEGRGAWRAPLTGELLSEELARVLGEPHFVGSDEPGFTFAIALRGPAARPHGAHLLERAAQVELSGTSMWKHRGAYVLYSIDVTVAHRASLSLCVPVVYGAPVAGTIQPVVGSTATLGAIARLEVVHVGAGVVQSWGESDDEVSVQVAPSGRSTEPPCVTFTCWPPSAAPFIEYQTHGSSGWFALFGPPGLAGAALDSADSTLDVRAYPLGALVRFDLPPLADALPVENLFDARLAHFRARNAEHLCSQLCTLTLAQPQSLQLRRLPSTLFPFERRDVTVESLVRELADLSASPIGFETERGAFTAHQATVGEVWLAALFGPR